MKLIFKTILMFGLAGVLLTYSGCKKHGETVVPVTDTQIDLLNKTWKVQSTTAVTKDGVVQTTYPTFTITFAGVHGSTSVPYTCGGRQFPNPWAASGTLTFSTSNPQTELTRDDATVVTYAVTSAQLQLSFTFSGTGYSSRSADVNGDWLFTMIPQ